MYRPETNAPGGSWKVEGDRDRQKEIKPNERMGGGWLIYIDTNIHANTIKLKLN